MLAPRRLLEDAAYDRSRLIAISATRAVPKRILYEYRYRYSCDNSVKAKLGMAVPRYRYRILGLEFKFYLSVDLPYNKGLNLDYYRIITKFSRALQSNLCTRVRKIVRKKKKFAL